MNEYTSEIIICIDSLPDLIDNRISGPLIPTDHV